MLIRLFILLKAGVVAFLVTYFYAAAQWPLWALLLGWAFVSALLIYGAVVWDRVDAKKRQEYPGPD